MTIPQLYDIYLQYPSVQTDTRNIKNGDIFFALKGPNFNGNSFAAKALELGAQFAIIDDPAFQINEHTILVDDVLSTLQQLARHHRQQFNIPFIGITGSNGKTTSKELVTAVLKQKFVTYATEGNLNNHIGVPLTLLKIKSDAQMAVIEMGANHQREIASYCEIALPNYAIINNCGKAHIEGFGGIEGVKKGKGELYDFIRESNGSIFINADLPYLAEMSMGIDKQISYGTQNAQYLGRIKEQSLMLHLLVEGDQESVEIQTNLVGEYNVPNVLLAVAVGSFFGINIQDIKTAIEAYQPDNSRSQFVSKGTNQIILDAYNANPTSMRAAINNFSKIEGPKILFLGAMKEMGAEEFAEHHELVTFIQQWNWQLVLLVGKEFKAVKQEHLWFEDADLAAEYIVNNKPQDALILIKGSRGSKMEKLLEVLG
jgi:UDP-N-acetylmuramoyl-tripeptide--D-alanyl-D-alanine ligase